MRVKPARRHAHQSRGPRAPPINGEFKMSRTAFVLALALFASANLHAAGTNIDKVNGAISAEAGTIEPGKLADLIAVQGSPLEDIARLRHVDFIMKSGRVAKQGGQMTEPFSYPAAFLQ